MNQIYNMIIAHAGGAIGGEKYSNSLDAILNSSSRLKIIEVDVLPAMDGLIVAHNNFEGKYGLKNKFDRISVTEFRTCRFSGKFKTLSFEDLVDLSTELDTKFVIDLKPVGKEYQMCIEEIASACQRKGVFDKFIVQVYAPEDYGVVRRYPFHGIMIAFWKNYNDIFRNDAQDFLQNCCYGRDYAFIGASLHFRRVSRENKIVDIRKKGGFGDSSIPIFIHAHPEDSEESLISNGYGVFSHAPTAFESENH